MRDDIGKRLKEAAGSAPDNGSFDEVWLRATQIQRRRAGIFSTVAASLSLVVVMSAGALTSSSDLQDQGVGMPAGSPSSSSPAIETVTVPDVTGLPVPLAQEILRDAGLEPVSTSDAQLEPKLPGEFEVKCDLIQPWPRKGEGSKGKDVSVSISCLPAGKVTGQDPLPGTVVAVGTAVHLRGPYEVVLEKHSELRSEMKKLERKLRREKP